MTWVWDHSRSRKNDRLVLLAIADCASDDGANAYPSMATLVRKTGLSERGVQTCIANLVRLGELKVQLNGGPRCCNRYRVTMSTPAESAPPQNLHPPAESAGGTSSTPAESAPHPRNPCGGPPQNLHPEPSPSVQEPPLPTPHDDPTATAAPEAETRRGGKDQPESKTEDDLTVLVAAIRVERPEWSTSAIRAALVEPSVLERPWPIRAAAMRIVAADPQSTAPGRLRASGTWWGKAADVVRARDRPAGQPPPCGKCGPNRQIEAADGRVIRCPDCHPLAEQPTRTA
jgi:hypothetical protein